MFPSWYFICNILDGGRGYIRIYWMYLILEVLGRFIYVRGLGIRGFLSRPRTWSLQRASIKANGELEMLGFQVSGLGFRFSGLGL